MGANETRLRVLGNQSSLLVDFETPHDKLLGALSMVSVHRAVHKFSYRKTQDHQN